MRTLLSVLTLALLISTCAMADTAIVNVAAEYPTLTSGPLASATLAELPSGTILRSGQIKITQKDLNAEIAKAPEEVRSQLKRNLFFVLENKATQMLLGYEASDWAKQNNNTPKSQEDLLKAYMSSLTSNLSVTTAESRAFFETNKDMMGGAAFDQVNDQIKDQLLSEKQQDAVQANIAALGTKYEIDVDKNWTAKQYSAAINNPLDQARKSGKPTMVDLGADGCRPCDMMTPILESLKTDYAGKVNVLFVHVRKEQILAARYGVQTIPVQVFFDKNGKEVFRHTGFFPRDQITAKFVEMGVK